MTYPDSGPVDSPPVELLSAAETALRLHVSLPHVQELVDQGELTLASGSQGAGHFSVDEVESLRARLKSKQGPALARLQLVSEELGLYDAELRAVRGID